LRALEHIAANMKRYIYTEKHPSHTGFRDMIPRVQEFVNAIQDEENAALDEANYAVAHRDLHFAKIMCDPTKPDIPSRPSWIGSLPVWCRRPDGTHHGLS
jgi:hypothetical protein